MVCRERCEPQLATDCLCYTSQVVPFSKQPEEIHGLIVTWNFGFTLKICKDYVLIV